MQKSPIKTILRLKSVMSRTGLSRSTIYALLKEGKFPKRLRLSLRTVGWLEHEIEAWIAERISASRDNAAA